MKAWAAVFLVIILALGLVACSDRDTRKQRFTDMEKKAASGDVSAWYSLGLMHEQGFGVAPDKSQAARCYRQAAEKGQVEAQYRLGFLYYHGQGVPRDLPQAAAWYKKAAEHGYAPAQAALGNLYLVGEGVPKDQTQAAHWYNKSLRVRNHIDFKGNQ